MKAQAEKEASERFGQVQSLVRAFSLLDELAAANGGMTLNEIAQVADLPRSTAHRLLTTMSALRYVEFEQSSKRWWIGVQGFALGNAFVPSRDLARLGRPIMRSLMIDAGETVNIAVESDDCVSYAGQIKPRNASGDAVEPGLPLPIHTTASGKILMAHWGQDRRDSFLDARTLYRRTPLTIVERAKMEAELGLIRERGFAIDDQENVMGTRCVATPVRNRNGKVVASLSISGPVSRIPDMRLTALGDTLAKAAQRMSADIGGLLTA